jgi:phosphoglycerate dehydrogenase-like enzyme
VVFTGTRNLALDAEALKQRGIPVSHTEWGPSKDSTAELTWALILGLHKRLVEQNKLIIDQQWRNQHSLLPVLKGQTLGLVGLGEIGSRVAKIALAFGMKVVTWSPNMTAQRAAAVGAESVSLDALMQTSDIVSLHIVASPATKGMINQEKLALMKKDALLINTSRSTLVDTNALVQALQNLNLPTPTSGRSYQVGEPRVRKYLTSHVPYAERSPPKQTSTCVHCEDDRPA